MTRRCGTCKWWERGASITEGECRAAPPVVSPVPTPNGPLSVTLFPGTGHDRWCGRHVLRENGHDPAGIPPPGAEPGNG